MADLPTEIPIRFIEADWNSSLAFRWSIRDLNPLPFDLVCNCPVAMCLKRQTPDGLRFKATGYGTAEFYTTDGTRRIMHYDINSPALVAAMRRFDYQTSDEFPGEVHTVLTRVEL